MEAMDEADDDDLAYESGADAWAPDLVRAYFAQYGGVRSLVHHQLEAYNYFVTTQQKETLRSMGPLLVKLDSEAVTTAPYPRRYYAREILVHFEDIRSEPPHVVEPSGARQLVFPSEARMRNMTYASRQSISLRIEYLTREQGTGRVLTRVESRLSDVVFLSLPVMFRSVLCNTTLHPELPERLLNECPHDPGGYFIVRGQEKTILQNQSQRLNMVLITAGSTTQKFLFQATMKFAAETETAMPKHLTVAVARKRNACGHPITVSFPRLKEKHAIDLFVFFRALGARSDTDILRYICDGQDATETAAVTAFLQASMLAAPKGVSTVDQAMEHIKHSVEYTGNKYLREDVISKKHLHYTYTLMRDDVFPQWPRGGGGGGTPTEKLMMLGQIVRKLVWTALGWIAPDSRDSFLNKRMNGVNMILNDLFRPMLLRVVRMFQASLCKLLRGRKRRAEVGGAPPHPAGETHASGESHTPPDAAGVWGAPPHWITKEVVERQLKVLVLQRALDKAMNSGDFSTSQYANKVGYCQILKRLSAVDSLAHLNRVLCCTDKNNEEIVENRRFDPRNVGYLCPLETPENAHVGQILQLAISARTTLPVSPHAALRALEGAFTPLRELDIRCAADAVRLHTDTKLFVNGVFLGVLLGARDPRPLVARLRGMKHDGRLHPYTAIVLDLVHNELRVNTESGRTVRPLFTVDPATDRIRFGAAHLRALRAGAIDWNHLLREGVVEYVDAEEHWFASMHVPCLAMAAPPRHRPAGSDVPLYDFAEISYAFLNGISAALIPFIGMNPSARNTYMSNMGKQSVGHYVSNFARRMDRTAYVQIYPGVPLVRNRLYDMLGLGGVPAGKQVNIAFMCYDGTNQEDSMTFNAAAVDRGLFQGFVFHTVKDDDKTAAPEDVLRTPPDPRTTIGIKDARYGKTNALGVMNPGQRVNPKDVFMTKVVPLSGLKATAMPSASAGGPQFEDLSRVHNKSNETAYVNDNYLGRDAYTGGHLVKTTLRAWRVPSMGDKFATRQAQKDTCGRKIPEHLMPYCLASGVVPDVILNTHCIPSRMTMALIEEMLLGKVCLLLGMRGDSSQRDAGFEMDALLQQLARLGADPTLRDVMVDPRTGSVIDTLIFHGPAYLTNLKHQTIDKEHYRNVGPVVKISRQPTEGRSVEGGMRAGEMERDVLVAHGCARLLHDRFFHCSDKYSLYVCPRCGLPMVGNNGEEYHRKQHGDQQYAALHMYKRQFYCRLCDQQEFAEELELPYAYKLHLQEMAAVNNVLRFVVQSAGASAPPHPTDDAAAQRCEDDGAAMMMGRGEMCVQRRGTTKKGKGMQRKRRKEGGVGSCC